MLIISVRNQETLIIEKAKHKDRKKIDCKIIVKERGLNYFVVGLNYFFL